MNGSKYYCENGAYHEYYCCDTCWNKHPRNKKSEMFLSSEKYYEVIKQDFIQEAIKHGFTKKQATFLYVYVNDT